MGDAPRKGTNWGKTRDGNNSSRHAVEIQVALKTGANNGNALYVEN